MEFRDFKISFSQLLKQNRIKDGVILMLVIANLAAVFGWLRTRETVVLVPPTLNERAQVSFSSASPSYTKSWGFYVTSLVGNVSPGNIDFVVESLGEILSPEVYHDVKAALARQIQEIKEESTTVTFSPQQIVYEDETKKVFVYGRIRVAGPGSKPRDIMRTYEYILDMRFGRPWVTHFDVYEGVPQTLTVVQEKKRGAGQSES
ncbi:MAG: TraE/TraK family type IV conjugative transfer system protein [Gammaproteobacteria bacterium]